MVIITPIRIPTPMSDGMDKDLEKILRLQTWLSPAFPIGGFSYSHGLEAAVEAGFVHTVEELVDWLSADLSEGAGRGDVILFASAWRATGAEDWSALCEAAELAGALRGTSEFALEAKAQGSAFLKTVMAVWPSARLTAAAGALRGAGLSSPVLPIAAGMAAASADVPLRPAAALFLQSTVANLVNAAVRLVPLGQTDGQRALAALEPEVVRVADIALGETLDDIGSAAFMVDMMSMRHETQYTRIFRS